MKSAREWKRFYAQERAHLGAEGLDELICRAPHVELPERGALIFPHTRLRESGELIAAAARAVVRSGREQILMLGVLHGGREVDGDRVARARAGDAAHLGELRRVHGPGTSGDAGIWTEEFSLDAFELLVAAAAQSEGRKAPRLIARYPFLVGENPADLPGLDDLRDMLRQDCGLVATADPVLYGVGYGTTALLAHTDPSAEKFARESIEHGLALLSAADIRAYLAHCAEVKSDFRDSGLILAELLGGAWTAHIHTLRLVDYAETLGAPAPTWVAGALTEITWA
jgi:hypothetical protein